MDTDTVALIRRRLDRYNAQRADLTNGRALAGSGARNLADVAIRVSYLDGKIDALEALLEPADPERGGPQR